MRTLLIPLAAAVLFSADGSSAHATTTFDETNPVDCAPQVICYYAPGWICLNGGDFMVNHCNWTYSGPFSGRCELPL